MGAPDGVVGSNPITVTIFKKTALSKDKAVFLCLGFAAKLELGLVAPSGVAGSNPITVTIL